MKRRLVFSTNLKRVRAVFGHSHAWLNDHGALIQGRKNLGLEWEPNAKKAMLAKPPPLKCQEKTKQNSVLLYMSLLLGRHDLPYRLP